MAPSLVIDASLALAWCFDDEMDDYADGVLGSLRDRRGVAPGIWPLEVANAMLMAERRGRLDEGDTHEIVALVRALPIVVVPDPPGRSTTAVMDLARTHRLTAYDATYLDLAIRERLPIATLDSRLRTAAQDAGVLLYEP